MIDIHGRENKGCNYGGSEVACSSRLLRLLQTMEAVLGKIHMYLELIRDYFEACYIEFDPDVHINTGEMKVLLSWLY